MRKEWTLFFTFLKIGAFTFGGGYAMIALLENEFVERKKWIKKDDFLNMVAIAESTPGPVAINSATYIGYKIAGLFGAAAATVAVCIPSFTVIFCISLFFDQFLSLTWVSRAFRGIQVCVIYLISSAGLKMLKTIERNAFNTVILLSVIAAMLACTVFAVSFSSVYYILICGTAGLAIFFLKKLRNDLPEIIPEFFNDRCPFLRRRIRNGFPCKRNSHFKRLANGKRILKFHCRFGIDARSACR